MKAIHPPERSGHCHRAAVPRKSRLHCFSPTAAPPSQSPPGGLAESGTEAAALAFARSFWISRAIRITSICSRVSFPPVVAGLVGVLEAGFEVTVWPSVRQRARVLRRAASLSRWRHPRRFLVLGKRVAGRLLARDGVSLSSCEHRAVFAAGVQVAVRTLRNEGERCSHYHRQIAHERMV